LNVDGRTIDDLPSFINALYVHHPDQVLKIDLLRGTQKLSVVLPVTVHHEKIEDLSDLPDLQQTLITQLGIFVTDIDAKLTPLLHGDDRDSGVVAIADAAGSNMVETGVQAGDVIRAINRTPLGSVSDLQAAVRNLKSGDPVVLQVERGGRLQYLAFEMD